MIADNQNTNDFPRGFLVKDKSGQLKKIQDDSLVDVQSFSVPSPVPKPGQPQKQPWSPQSPISASPKAAFYFAPEDEDEIKKHAEALKELIARPAPVQTGESARDVAAAAQKIVAQQAIHFDEEILNRRFQKVIESFFNEVRTPLETEEVLTRPQKIGGLALAPEVAKKIVASAQEIAKTLQPRAKQPLPAALPFLPEQKAAGMVTPPPPAFVPRPQPKPQAPAPPTIERKVEIEPTTAALAQEIKQEIAAAQKQVEQPITPPLTAERPIGIAYARPQEPSRPQMIDIKQPMSVVGPVEELGLIDVKEFRRLGRTASEAGQKVLEKIELLQEESWQMRTDGIKAWKQSEMVRLYTELGRQSVESGVPLASVLRSREQEGKPYISMDEFLAINHVNSLLTA